MKIAEFADAIGEPSPVCRDRAAAQAVGYPDVIAPPTFAIVVSAVSRETVTHDPGLGVNNDMIVHGELRFSHARPMHAGDLLVVQTTIESIKQVRNMTTLMTVSEIKTVDGEHVCTTWSTLVERGE